MFDDSRAFVSRAFLRSALGMEYLAWSDEQDGELRARLLNWAGRKKLKETSAEGAFLQAFFVETWAMRTQAASRVRPSASIPSCASMARGLAAGWARLTPP